MLLTVTHALWLSRSLENAYDCLEHKLQGKGGTKEKRMVANVIAQQEKEMHAMLKQATLCNGRSYLTGEAGHARLHPHD